MRGLKCAERIAGMTSTETVAITGAGAEKVFKYLECQEAVVW